MTLFDRPDGVMNGLGVRFFFVIFIAYLIVSCNHGLLDVYIPLGWIESLVIVDMSQILVPFAFLAANTPCFLF